VLGQRLHDGAAKHIRTHDIMVSSATPTIDLKRPRGLRKGKIVDQGSFPVCAEQCLLQDVRLSDAKKEIGVK